MARDIKAKRTGEVSASADELYRFIGRVRAGQAVDGGELVKFARLFNDELTLDRLDRCAALGGVVCWFWVVLLCRGLCVFVLCVVAVVGCVLSCPSGLL